MINNKRVAVILPAFNAEKTLRKTVDEIPREIVDLIILTDDCSTDKTVTLAKELNVDYIIEHSFNSGYGANQKSCYNKALELDADIIIMLHPDYQYTPKLIPSMAYLISLGIYDVVIGSRIIGSTALSGGMPLYKYIFNRLLTLFQNLMLNSKLSEFHTGYRAFSKEVLNSISFNQNSNDFVFDNEILAQIIFNKFKIGEISCPTRYDENSSSISFLPSVRYGLGVLKVSFTYFLVKTLKVQSKLFNLL
jgi:glycosyltransferase involved in cell wall biosynthesis